MIITHCHRCVLLRLLELWVWSTIYHYSSSIPLSDKQALECARADKTTVSFRSTSVSLSLVCLVWSLQQWMCKQTCACTIHAHAHSHTHTHTQISLWHLCDPSPARLAELTSFFKLPQTNNTLHLENHLSGQTSLHSVLDGNYSHALLRSERWISQLIASSNRWRCVNAADHRYAYMVTAVVDSFNCRWVKTFRSLGSEAQLIFYGTSKVDMTQHSYTQIKASFHHNLSLTFYSWRKEPQEQCWGRGRQWGRWWPPLGM